MAGSKYYSTINFVKGYHLIPVRSQYIEKTAFVTHESHFENKAMTFGLSNAPGTCLRLMYIDLDGIIKKSVPVVLI